jgi:hypothetical protein
MKKIDLIRDRIYNIIDEHLKEIYKNEMRVLIKEFEDEIKKEVKKDGNEKTSKQHRNSSRKLYS